MCQLDKASLSFSSARAYDDPRSRLRAIYQIPSADACGTVLELKLGDDAWITDGQWPTAQVVRCRLEDEAPAGAKPVPRSAGVHDCEASIRKELPFAPGYFDVVLLHFTLDRLASQFQASRRPLRTAEDWLRQVHRILKPGGVVVGCAANRTSPKFLLSGASAPPLGVHNAVAALGRCGFGGIRVFNLLTDAASPRAIVSVAPVLSKRAFGRELEAIRASLTTFGYLLRAAFVRLGFNRFFERTLFFWAYKP